MRKPKHHHSDRNRIMTPIGVASKLVNKIPYDVTDTWCDPCFGEGAFYNSFPAEHRDWYEIDKGKDFLLATGSWDWVVTNIPFSQPKEFIFKMAESCKKGFGILCLANSMTATRLLELSKQGLYLNSMTVLYIREWGFGYRTDFYVFTRDMKPEFEIVLE